jgi:apolipoprotein N-acyltransferase
MTLLERLSSSVWVRIFAAAASAVLMAFAFPPYQLGWLAWFGLVPLLLALRGLGRGKTYIIAAVWAIIFSLLVTDFYFWGRSPVFVLIIILGILMQTIVISELSLLTQKVSRWGWLLFAGLWIGVSFFISFLVGLFYFLPPDLPFSTFANTQWLYPVMLQTLPVAGEYALSFLILLINCGLTEAVSNFKTWKWITPMAVILVLLVMSVGWGVIRLNNEGATEMVGTTVLPTGGDISENGTAVAMTRQFVAYADSNRTLPNGTLLPEISIIAWAEMPVGDLTDAAVVAQAGAFAREMGKYLVVNFYDTRAEGQNYNVAVVFGPDGALLAQNAKHKIPPIVEGSTAADSGGPQEAAMTPWGEMSTLICYESFFPGLVRNTVLNGVDFLVIPANAVSGKTPRFTALHVSQTILRAAENHVAIVFSYAGGLSALIGSNGQLLVHESLDAGRYMKEDVTISGVLTVGKGGSLYTKVGDVFPWVLLGISAIYWLLSKLRTDKTVKAK